MRRRNLILMAFLAAAAGCVSYPLLESAGDPGGSGGSSGGGSSTGGGSGGTGGSSGGGQAGPTQPGEDGESPDEPVLLTGRIDLVPCEAIVIIDFDAQGRPDQAFEISDDSIAEWLVGDDIEFDEDANEITNVSRGETFAARTLGGFDVTTRFVQRNDITLAAELQDGTVWLFTVANFNEVRQWLTGNDTISIVRESSTSRDGVLINHRRCTATSATAATSR